MKLDSQIEIFIKKHLSDDVNLLALQSSRHTTNIDVQFAIQQIRGRQIAKIKMPSWFQTEGIIYPKHLSLEQCSSEYTAHYKAKLCFGDTMVDLTGGLGVDCAFISQKFRQTTYVEQQEELAKIAKNNFGVLKLVNIKVVQGDAVDFLKEMPAADLIYIDPARRSSSGSKTVFIEDCTPNIIDIESFLELKSKKTIIKLSPMLDISLALKSINNVSDIYIISYHNECKELLFIKNNEVKSDNTLLHCINMNGTKTDEFTFCRDDENNTVVHYADKIGKYLYEPNTSIIKAGAYKSIASKFGISKLHISSHLYTSNDLHEDFQGRIFAVDNIFSLNKKDIKVHLQNIKQANISTRNFPLNPQELRKKLKLKDGGDTYIFGTTLADERKVVIIGHKI